jgi:rhodanese-related sulfurtransferase|tara:strand:+ start:1336 stop:1929 length:594 start_codon:yes stop_codon:yes gene_type:complete
MTIITNETIGPESTMGKVLSVFPGARRALFRKYHIGGCSGCGFSMDETLSELCERNQRLDIDEVLAHIRTSHDADAKIMIEPKTLKELQEANPKLKILDVRTKEEFEAARIKDSIHMTVQVGSKTNCTTTAQDLLHQVVDNWDPNELFVIIDHQGEQGPDVATYFLGHGMKQARCLRGGIDAWSLEVDNSVPRYEFA